MKKTRISKILVVFGTRPEAIKMSPLVKELKLSFNVSVCVTAQHRQLLDQVLNLFKVTPDYDLDLMKPKQDLFDVTLGVLAGFKDVLLKDNPDIVLVHGDTTSAMAASLASLYHKIPVGRIEAGLRTGDIYSPFPEELNRQLISKLSQFHFAPTEKAKQNLLDEKIDKKKIYVTGNTVIDAMFSMIELARKINFSEDLLRLLPFLNLESDISRRIILVTGHRRENFGSGFNQICEALSHIANQNPDVEIVYPVHMNPNVQEPVKRILSAIKNVHLIEPLDYISFIKMMDLSYLILTDSGGVQEEAPSLGKPVILMRDSTERPEALEAGTVKLVGSNKNKIISNVELLLNNNFEYKKMSLSHNPYGDGHACKRIREILERNEYEG